MIGSVVFLDDIFKNKWIDYVLINVLFLLVLVYKKVNNKKELKFNWNCLKYGFFLILNYCWYFRYMVDFINICIKS